MPAHAPTTGRARFDRLDALRGAAIVWMIGYHFCFDLNHFGLIAPQRFNLDPFWWGQRTAIVSLFLLCAGLGQAVALQQGQGWPRFWRRWAQVAGCAVLVSLGSWWMFPRSFIFFGVLHGIAVMLLITRGLGAGRWLWPAGLAALLAPWWLSHEVFNPAWAAWTGLVTRKPLTEDFVPLLPWIGVMWWGVAAGTWLLHERAHWLRGAVPRPLAPLAFLGRWSLSVYMLHQPLLMGALSAWVALAR